MVTASVQGIFNVLILGFGLTGPHRIISGESSIPIELDAPTIRPPFATPVTTTVMGTISTSSSGTINLAPRAVLSLLRGFFTLGVTANKSRTDLEAGKIDVAGVTLLAAEFLQREFSGYLTAEDDPRFRDPQQDTSSTRGFYGLADTLAFSLSHFSRLEPPEDKALMQQLTALIRSSLVEHPQHSAFAKNTSQDVLAGLTPPDFKKCRNGPLVDFLASASHWSFWRDWYQGFLDGKPLDWELQRRVALIPDEDWEKGPEHIAQKIEEIRKGFEAPKAREEERHPDLEPPSLENVLRAPSISAAQIEAAAQDIKEAECKYLNDTGANQLPEQFEMLPKIAYSLSVVGTQIRKHKTDPSVEEGLRQEVGRLNARILELETQLQALQSSNDPIFAPALKEQIGKSLGDWKMYGAMLGAVWLMSGDTVGMQTRLENLGAVRDSLFGTHSPAPIEQVQTLPESTDV